MLTKWRKTLFGDMTHAAEVKLLASTAQGQTRKNSANSTQIRSSILSELTSAISGSSDVLSAPVLRAFVDQVEDEFKV